MASRLAAASRALETRWGVRLVRWGVIALMVTSLAACMASGANRPADPRLEGRSRVPGFGEVGFRVRPASGPVSAGQYCALLAETNTQIQTGLMRRRDLAGYDAMVFRFAGDSNTSFYMRAVPVPLSVAWFDSEGRFISSADMAPCPDRAGCPLYPADRPYRYAVEVPAGGLGRLGIGPGSVLEVDGPCQSR